jgi:hypothetical protein
MSTYAIIETNINGDTPEDPEDNCYLNHAYLSSMSFGSLDMAWTTESRLEAEGMAARLTGRKYRHHAIVEIF